MTAQADEVDLTPGPTIIADPDSPTGYTGHFVYYNPTATSVRFVADILLRDWDNPTSTDRLPAAAVPARSDARRRGVRRADDERRQRLLGHRRAARRRPQPVLVLRQQQHQPWVADPANPPLYAPDGLTGNARRAFNAVYVPYDAEKQNYAPLAERVIANPAARLAEGHVELRADPDRDRQSDAGRVPAAGIRPEPRRAVQDDLPAARQRPGPVRLDEHRQRPDHHGQPARRTASPNPRSSSRRTRQYMGASPYNNLTNIIIPFVQSHYNVSTKRMDRAFAGLSDGRVDDDQHHQQQPAALRLLRRVQLPSPRSTRERRT